MHDILLLGKFGEEQRVFYLNGSWIGDFAESKVEKQLIAQRNFFTYITKCKLFTSGCNYKIFFEIALNKQTNFRGIRYIFNMNALHKFVFQDMFKIMCGHFQ